MLPQLIDSGPLLAIIAKHLYDEILELRTEGLASNLFPILLHFAIQDEAVKVFVLLGLFERENALDNDE